jgi:hypothetical protein
MSPSPADLSKQRESIDDRSWRRSAAALAG